MGKTHILPESTHFISQDIYIIHIVKFWFAIRWPSLTDTFFLFCLAEILKDFSTSISISLWILVRSSPSSSILCRRWMEVDLQPSQWRITPFCWDSLLKSQIFAIKLYFKKKSSLEWVRAAIQLFGSLFSVLDSKCFLHIYISTDSSVREVGTSS